MLDLCVDYVGRDGAIDMREAAARLATASTLPLMIDSTEWEVIEAGLECLGGRSIVNSVHYEDGNGPESNFAKKMAVVRDIDRDLDLAITEFAPGSERTKDKRIHQPIGFTAPYLYRNGRWEPASNDPLPDRRWMERCARGFAAAYSRITSRWCSAHEL